MAVDTSKLARIVGNKGTSNVSGNLMEQSRYRAPIPNIGPVADSQAYTKSLGQTPMAPNKPITPTSQAPTGIGTPMQKALEQFNAPNQNFLSKALNAIPISAAAVEQYGMVPLIKSRAPKGFYGDANSYDTILDKVGIKNTPGKLDFNDVASNTARMVADPLNLVGAGMVDDVVKYGSKIPAVARAIGGLNKAADVARELPVIKQVGNTFVKGFELMSKNKWVEDVIEKIPFRQAEMAKPKIDELVRVYGDIAKDPKKRELLTDALLSTTKKGEGFDNFLARAGKDFEDIRPQFEHAQKLFKSQLDEMLANKVITKKQFTEFSSSGYFPSSGFDKKIGDYLQLTGIKEKRNYLMKKTYAAGFTRNAPEAIMRRTIQQTQDDAIREGLSIINKRNGVTVKPGQVMPEGKVRIIDLLKERGMDVSSKGWAVFKNRAIDRDIASHLIGKFQSKGGFLGGFGELLGVANKPFKFLATAPNPAFHVGNKIGNLFNVTVHGGMRNPKRILQDVTGVFNKEEKAIIEKLGVKSGGFFGVEDAADLFKDKGLIKSGAEKLLSGPKVLGRKIEDASRSAFGLDQYYKAIDKGMDETQAIDFARQQVNKILFDYKNGLTGFERGTLGRIFPFYTWARKNIPLQIEGLWKRPGAMGNYVKIKNAINPEGPPPGMPQGIYIKAGNTKDGKQLYWSPNLPINDLLQMDTKKAADMLSPIIKDGMEIFHYLSDPKYVPTDWFTGKAMTDRNLPVGEQRRDLAKHFAKSYIRPFKSGSKIEEEGGMTMENILKYYILGSMVTVDEKAAKRREIEAQTAPQRAIKTRLRSNEKSKDSQKTKDTNTKRLRSYQ